MGYGMEVESPLKVVSVAFVPDLQRTARTEVKLKRGTMKAPNAFGFAAFYLFLNLVSCFLNLVS